MSRNLRVLLLVVAVIFTGASGFVFGSQTTRTKVPLDVEPGVVVLQDRETGFTLFDGADGTQFAFDATEITWSHAGQTGRGQSPECLRRGEKVPAEVGYRWIRFPDGGAQQEPLWLSC